MYKSESLYDVSKEQTSNNDILHAVVKVGGEMLHVVLLYFSVISKQEDKVRNAKIKKEVEKIIVQVKEEQQAVMILGDFNGHISGLGKQREDETGRTVLEWINEHAMILLNMDDRCTGLFTWQRKDQTSAIDFVMMNNKCYAWFEETVS